MIDIFRRSPRVLDDTLLMGRPRSGGHARADAHALDPIDAAVRRQPHRGRFHAPAAEAGLAEDRLQSRLLHAPAGSGKTHGPSPKSSRNHRKLLRTAARTLQREEPTITKRGFGM